MSKKKSGKDRMDRYSGYIRGPANNRYGGHQMQRERGLRGNTYGSANEGRSLSDEERRAWALANGYAAT